MDDYKTFRLNAIRVGTPCWGEGQPGKPMLLGLQPSQGEKLPFTSGPSLYMRAALERLGVPHARFVYLNYLFKVVPDRSELIDAVFLAKHVGITQKEIEVYLKPRAVIILGLQTFNTLFSRTEGDIESLRRVRWFHGRMPDVNFFVTYSPEEVLASEERGDVGVGRDWFADLMAVFETNVNYFKTTKFLRVP